MSSHFRHPYSWDNYNLSDDNRICARPQADDVAIVNHLSGLKLSYLYLLKLLHCGLTQAEFHSTGQQSVGHLRARHDQRERVRRCRARKHPTPSSLYAIWPRPRPCPNRVRLAFVVGISLTGCFRNRMLNASSMEASWQQGRPHPP